jgi:hypothetical protein
LASKVMKERRQKAHASERETRVGFGSLAILTEWNWVWA